MKYNDHFCNNKKTLAGKSGLNHVSKKFKRKLYKKLDMISQYQDGKTDLKWVGVGNFLAKTAVCSTIVFGIGFGQHSCTLM